MAKTSGTLVARRQELVDVSLHGVPVTQISRHLNAPKRTAWRDVAAIRPEHAKANRATLEERRARSTVSRSTGVLTAHSDHRIRSPASLLNPLNLSARWDRALSSSS